MTQTVTTVYKCDRCRRERHITNDMTIGRTVKTGPPMHYDILIPTIELSVAGDSSRTSIVKAELCVDCMPGFARRLQTAYDYATGRSDE
jgi:hypothetical protein